jgi:hypothetical protein
MFAEAIAELIDTTNTVRDAQLRALELERRRLDATIAANVAVGFNRQVHLDDGHRTMKAYLRATCNWSPAQINRVCRAATLIDTHPTVGEIWMAGHIGADQVDELARAFAHPRAGSQLGEFLPALLDHAEHLRYDDFRICVQRFVLLADTDGAHRDTDRLHAERNAHVTATADGGIDICVTGGNAITTTEFVTIFQRHVQAEFQRDVDTRRTLHGDTADQHPLPRTAAQRRHDAIHTIFLTAVTAPTNGRRPEPVVNILCDATTFTNALRRHHLYDDTELDQQLLDNAPDLINRRCETTTGVVVHPDHMLRAALSGHIRRVVIDSAGVVIDMGRLQRLFTGSARTAAQLLTRTCTHPGCTIPAHLCDIDHMQPWAAANGHTNQHNAAPLCNPHDRHKHRAKWHTRRATNGRIYSIRADGTIVLPAGERPPNFHDPDNDPATLAHITHIARQRALALATNTTNTTRTSAAQ